MEIALLVLVSIAVILLVIIMIFQFLRRPSSEVIQDEMASIRQESIQSQSNMRKDVNDHLRSLNRITLETVSRSAETSARNTELMRNAIDSRLNDIRNENREALEAIQTSVNEKLSEELSSSLERSFKSVSFQLDQVSKNLHEIETIGTDINGLKNVLSNVKNRGTWGEVQLESILEDILPPNQYMTQHSLEGRTERVDFAIRLPGKDGSEIILPIDSKFPMDKYESFLEAEAGTDAALKDSAKGQLISAIRSQAKSISKKYIVPPYTTDFAVMFIPSEGLYNILMSDTGIYALQQETHVLISGPVNTAALLNSLLMGFRTIAIQARTSEITRALKDIRKNMDNLVDLVQISQRNVSSASSNLDKLSSSLSRLRTRLERIEDLDDGSGEADE